MTDIGQMVLKMYLRVRRIVEPGYQSQDGRHGIDFWGTLAVELSIDHRIDPEDYIFTVFERYELPLWPTSLLSAGCQAEYARLKPSWTDDKTALLIQLNMDSFHWLKEKSSPAGALASEAHSFTRLFKWCMAVRHGLTSLEKQYRSQSLRSVMNPAMREEYEKSFPAEMEIMRRCLGDEKEYTA